MTEITVQNALSDLEKVLDQERAGLLDGDFRRVAALFERKEKIVDYLNASAFDQLREFSGLQAKLKRNQALLNGAQDGIKAISRRVATLIQLQKTLGTYDASGRKADADENQKHTIEKRA